MSNEVNYHPSDELLTGFAEGTLSAGMSVVISAHTEQCSACGQRVRDFESEASVQWLESSETVANQNAKSVAEPDFSSMIADITSHAQSQHVSENQGANTEIHMLDHSVRLPKVLAKIASEGLVWKKLAGGINQAAVMLDDKTQCEFIYMKPGSQVPVHKHQGTEVTLVLDGSFSDELGQYHPQDFLVRDNSHTHQPASEEGCLCFAVLDSPLAFTNGLARLLNPILRYRFRRATSLG